MSLENKANKPLAKGEISIIKLDKDGYARNVGIGDGRESAFFYEPRYKAEMALLTLRLEEASKNLGVPIQRLLNRLNAGEEIRYIPKP